ncbi:MAG: ribulose 1,5-bisphosphate carboxylase, partial [Deltaproteobacteria bacterium]|nr:ribulose 1,5-bisphosphate carboxylase [Deltaproteobacteria bacterium]
MKPIDIPHFKAKKSELNLEQYIILTYFFESQTDPEEAALHLCQEQSTAQWKRVGIDEDFRPKHGAKLLDMEILEVKDQPFFQSPFNKGPKFYNCKATIAHPHINFGPKIPNMLTTILGEGVFYAPGITAIKLMNIDFPEIFLKNFQGPQFGLEGIRNLLEVYDRPLFFGVIKPNIGLTPKDFAAVAYESWLGGLDVPKDDEMLADASYSTLYERTKLLGELRKKAEAITGEKKFFLANITDEVDKIQTNHDIAIANGVNAVMLN